MTEIITEILEKIYFNTNGLKTDSSLMIGNGGDLIFKYLYLKHFSVPAGFSQQALKIITQPP